MYQMQLTAEQEEAWEKLSPALDDAIATLSESDRHAVQLRFYESKSLAQVGEILGISEEAAKKRVARAIDKLRSYFSREGVKVSTGLILTALAVPAAQAAPLSLFHATVAAGTSSTTGGTALAASIAQGALRAMFQADARLVYAMMGATGLAIVVVAVVAAQFMALAPPSLVVNGETEKPLVNVIQPPPEADPPLLPVERSDGMPFGRSDGVLRASDISVGSAAGPLDSFTPHLPPDDTYAVATDRTGSTWYRKVQRDVLAGGMPDIRTVHRLPPPAMRGFEPVAQAPSFMPAARAWERSTRDGLQLRPLSAAERSLPLPAWRYHDNIGGDGGLNTAPTPEPSTSITVLIGMGIGALRRRR
jgi:hypothetical protein